MDEKIIKQKLKDGWLRIRMIQEIAGFPESYVLESMDKMNGQLVSMQGVEVIERQVHKPKQVREGVWSMFAEIELLVQNFPIILLIVLSFMPSSIEIIEPVGKISTDTQELTGAINDLIGKLHHLDATSKKYYAVTKVLERKLKEKESSNN